MSSTPTPAVHRHAPVFAGHPAGIVVWGSDEILRAVGRSRGEVPRG